MTRLFRMLVGLPLVFALGGCPDGADPDLDVLFGEASLACEGDVDGGTVGDVEVKNDGVCTLTGVTVTGNVKVVDGASLVIVNGVVHGNVQGDGAFSVEVRGTSVRGNVQIQNGRFVIVADAAVHGDIQVEKANHLDDGTVLVTGNDVTGGNIQIAENRVLMLDVSANVVRNGNLQVFKNGGGGDKLVADNDVAQNLQCKENASPFTAAGNVAGDREGQCVQ